MTKLEFIQSIRQFIADGKTEDALHLLREKICDYDTDTLTDATILESRFQNAKSDCVIKGILAREDYDRTVAQVNFAILELLEKMEKTTILLSNASKNKSSGRILHNIPGIMPLGRESRCIVRIAFDDEILTRDFQLTKDTIIQSVRIAEVMGVELLDFNETPAFQIRTITEEEQFLASDDFTQWIFQVKPIHEGKFPLTLKVCVIEEIDGRERKRDIVLEKEVFIINQPTEPAAAPQRNTVSNSKIAFEETNIHLNYNVTENQGAGAQTAPKKKSMTAIVSAMATVIFAITGLVLYQKANSIPEPNIVSIPQDTVNMHGSPQNFPQNFPQNKSELAENTQQNMDSLFENIQPGGGIPDTFGVFANTQPPKLEKKIETVEKNQDVASVKPKPVKKSTVNRQKKGDDIIESGNRNRSKNGNKNTKSNKTQDNFPQNPAFPTTDANQKASTEANKPVELEMKTYKVNIKLRDEMKDADILVNGEKPINVKKNIWGTPKYVEFKSNKKLQSFTFIKEGVSCKVENIDVTSGSVSIEACSFKKKSTN